VVLGLIAALIGTQVRAGGRMAGRRRRRCPASIPDFLWALILLLLFGVLVPPAPDFRAASIRRIDVSFHSNFY